MDLNFEELDVYKKAIDFVSNIYSSTRTFPKEEFFGLSGQLRRAAISISANISEGSARTKKGLSRLIDIARGFVFECITLLQISAKQKHIGQQTYSEFRGNLTELSKMLSGLKNSIIQ